MAASLTCNIGNLKNVRIVDAGGCVPRWFDVKAPVPCSAPTSEIIQMWPCQIQKQKKQVGGRNHSNVAMPNTKTKETSGGASTVGTRAKSTPDVCR
jgi:hypothetical protein